MKVPDLSLGKEWALLELITEGVERDESCAAFAELIRRRELDWGQVLLQAVSHRLTAMLAYCTISKGMAEYVPRFVRELLQRELAYNRYKNRLLRHEAERVAAAFQRAGVPVAATKGIILESTIYAGEGSRMLRDLDFMVEFDSWQVVIKLMSELGYTMGQYTWSLGGGIAPFSARELATYKLAKCHLPEFVKELDDLAVPSVSVDFATSLTWGRSPYVIPVDRVLAESVAQTMEGVDRGRLPSLSLRFQFIFTVLHLFREAWMERWVTVENDVSLSKFMDVIRLWKVVTDRGLTGVIAASLEEFGIVDPVLWVLVHCDRTFKTTMTSTLGMEGRVGEEWLASGMSSRGKRRRWSGSMRERLHSANRAALFEPVE